MTLIREISWGDILAAITIIISASAILIAWIRDQQLKRKEYADRIRKGAAEITAKLERRIELSLGLFEEIQSIITEADMNLTKEEDIIATRDFLWRELVKARSTCSRRMLDERIEMAYSDLYGYDPRIQSLFTTAIKGFKSIDTNIFHLLLHSSQDDVLNSKSEKEHFFSGKLGNKLRNTCSDLTDKCRALLLKVFNPFREEMVKLIKLKDKIIVCRKEKIRKPEDIRKIIPDKKIIDFTTTIFEEKYFPKRIICEERKAPKLHDLSINENILTPNSTELNTQFKRSFPIEKTTEKPSQKQNSNASLKPKKSS